MTDVPYEEFEPVETTVGVDSIADALTVRVVRIASPLKDLTGRTIPLGAVIFTFGNSNTQADDQPVTFVATPEYLRKLGVLVRDAAYRAANMAEGKA